MFNLLRAKDLPIYLLQEVHFFENTTSIWSVECVRLAVGPAPKVNLKGKYHANLMSFPNPKMFVCQQKQTNK